ncbi:MAG: endonuclease/exonuclease/phosphatase family protein [Gammaproteobacteria bacterium]|nr:MAG: endonuclease/exonuclease/phosphatase family protein [Gammaproteobacteria bacterium]
MDIFRQPLIGLLMVNALGACTPLHQPDPAQPLANHDAPAARGVAACRVALSAEMPVSGPMLDPQHIELFVWNIHKGRNPDSLADLDRLAGDKDLVLIQEARLEQQPVDALDQARYWSFAPGYRTARASTGVMTLSHTMPLVHCYLTDREPWLRSPKAISITMFGLAGTDATLAVVNVHAVNFTFGIRAFARQIAKIETALADHAGPVILAGDFNTWHARRLAVLQTLSEHLNLHELSFDVDNRVASFGSVVDRIFIRGLDTIDATTNLVDTSDHNPMSVTLRLQCT